MWAYWMRKHLVVNASIWWTSISNEEYNRLITLPDEELEQVFLDKWSHAKKKDQ